MEKEGEKIIFVGVWLERRAECKLVEWGCFLSRSTKILSPKIEEINREKKASCLGGWKNQCVKSTCSVVFFFGLFIYLFWFSSLVFVFFCTSHFFFSHLFWMLFYYLGPPKFFLLKLRRKIKRKRFLTCVDERTNV